MLSDAFLRKLNSDDINSHQKSNANAKQLDKHSSIRMQ